MKNTQPSTTIKDRLLTHNWSFNDPIVKNYREKAIMKMSVEESNHFYVMLERAIEARIHVAVTVKKPKDVDRHAAFLRRENIKGARNAEKLLYDEIAQSKNLSSKSKTILGLECAVADTSELHVHTLATLPENILKQWYGFQIEIYDLGFVEGMKKRANISIPLLKLIAEVKRPHVFHEIMWHKFDFAKTLEEKLETLMVGVNNLKNMVGVTSLKDGAGVDKDITPISEKINDTIDSLLPEYIKKNKLEGVPKEWVLLTITG